MDYSHIPFPTEDMGPHIQQRHFFISADLGQSNDYTAISVLERITTGEGWLGYRGNGLREHHLRHLERHRGVSYVDIADRLTELFHAPQLEDHDRALIFDRTGLGSPFHDMLLASGFRAALTGITITGGDVPTFNNRAWHVPKRDLVSSLQLLLQSGNLKIARGLQDADVFLDEMAAFRTKITASAHDLYGAKGTGHDDVVLSVAMACWAATQRKWRFGNVDNM